MQVVPLKTFAVYAIADYERNIVVCTSYIPHSQILLTYGWIAEKVTGKYWAKYGVTCKQILSSQLQ